jgi:hypothetical protein
MRMWRTNSASGASGLWMRRSLKASQAVAVDDRQDGGDRAAGHAELRQAAPAAYQRRCDDQADHGGNAQCVERVHGVAHAAQHGGGQQVDEEAGPGNHHDAGVERGIGQDVGRRAQGAEQRPGEDAAEQGDQQAEGQAHAERGAGNRLDLAGVARPPGLAYQH